MLYHWAVWFVDEFAWNKCTSNSDVIVYKLIVSTHISNFTNYKQFQTKWCVKIAAVLGGDTTYVFDKKATRILHEDGGNLNVLKK